MSSVNSVLVGTEISVKKRVQGAYSLEAWPLCIALQHAAHAQTPTSPRRSKRPPRLSALSIRPFTPALCLVV
jgi:hypothetical protein